MSGTKRNVLTRVVGIFVALFFVVGFWQASSYAAKPAPDSVTLQSKKGNVTFNHKKHVDSKIECKTCHHKMAEKPDDMGCNTCHGKDGAPSMKDAAHKNCKDCHKTKGAGPTKCDECHKK